MPRGYNSVASMLTAPSFGIAHRGGSKNWPELSGYAFTQAAYWGAGSFEFSVARSSDGVFFGLHDDTLDRTSGTTGAVASTMTWAQINSYLINAAGTDNPVQAAQPYFKLDDYLQAYGQSHVLFFDPKYVAAAHWPALFSMLAPYINRVVGKFYVTNVAFAQACRAQGIKTWGYAYPADIPALAGLQADWDMLGMTYSATQAEWNSVLVHGKPVVGHICPDAAAVSLAISKGASGVMVSGVTQGIVRR